METDHDAALHSDPPLTARSFPGSTIAALRELFLQMVRTESQAIADGAMRAGADVRNALRHLCEDARRHNVRAEQLVIAIKQGWSALQRDRPQPRASGPDELLNHVITVCIDEYYAASEPK